ncbi:MAG: phosphoribosyltransferase [Spirochaetaceae bacterium]|nr:phosphoribosyltransferase [Spirochaetaceae bacterium]
MKKLFIKADTVRNNGFALAKKLIEQNYIPDVMYISMRGGAPLGNAINEFFKIALGKNYKTIFATLVAHSYSGIQQQSEVIFDGWTYELGKLDTNQKILIVDDICDSGATLQKLAETFKDIQFPSENVRFAVHDYKCFHYEGARSVGFVPDYYCNVYNIHSEQENLWIHYLSHELFGLTDEEFRKHYLEDYPELKSIFEGILV